MLDINDLENLSDDELTRIERMININKMIQETNQNHEINMATIAKMKAETDKLAKGNHYYPIVVFGGIGTMLGGLLVALGSFLAKFIG